MTRLYFNKFPEDEKFCGQGLKLLFCETLISNIKLVSNDFTFLTYYMNNELEAKNKYGTDEQLGDILPCLLRMTFHILQLYAFSSEPFKQKRRQVKH